ncbi:hypothetical protein FCG41_05705 [Azotobacter chroococcum]|jgi:hypothetical protein|nr:hypothetical protein FCG41_05705 [Azotobacter chroococcum]
MPTSIEFRRPCVKNHTAFIKRSTLHLPSFTLIAARLTNRRAHYARPPDSPHAAARQLLSQMKD